jgi:hypothetical protein
MPAGATPDGGSRQKSLPLLDICEITGKITRMPRFGKPVIVLIKQSYIFSVDYRREIG